jgi:hypothetical protein
VKFGCRPRREAVNNRGQLGTWTLHVCHSPQLLDNETGAPGARGSADHTATLSLIPSLGA